MRYSFSLSWVTHKFYGGASFLNERIGNVYEKKGSTWKRWEHIGNVYENTCT